MIPVLLSIVMSSAAGAGVTFEPPAGRVIHMAGQTREQFPDYVAGITGNGGACPLPAGAAAYMALTHDAFAGAVVIGENDTQDVPYLLSRDWPMALHLALWLGAYELEDIAAGRKDDLVRRMGRGITGARRPVFLRIGYEFDGPHNAYPPDKFVRAYRHIHGILRGTKVRNVAYVWHSFANRKTFGGNDPAAWYPGDDCVDWVGVSFFGTDHPDMNRERLLEIARAKGKPVMICEASAIKDAPHRGLSGGKYWEYWYVPFFEFIEKNPEVKAFSIINCDWDSIPMFRDIGWGNALMTADEVVVERWREKMKDPRYLHSSGDLYGELGYHD